MIYLTEMLRLPVLDSSGRRIGRLSELALVPAEDGRRVAQFVVSSQKRRLAVPYQKVQEMTAEGLKISGDPEQLAAYVPADDQLLVTKDLLDQQIIDANGRKVVRVNDLTLTIESVGERQELWVLEVDVGVRGAFRRLLEGVAPPATIRRLQEPIKPSSIRWEY